VTEVWATTLGAWIRDERTSLDVSVHELSAIAEVSIDRLEQMERGMVLGAVGELRKLSYVLGADLAGWDPDEEPRPAPAAQVRTLFKANKASVRAADWPAILALSSVARDVVALESALGAPSRMDKIRRRWSSAAVDDSNPGRDGQRLAELVRRQLSLTMDGPIPSMSRLLEELGVLVIQGTLPPGVDALCFADDQHGPVAALSIAPEVPAFVRRYRLAHELCHILFDRHASEALQTLDRFERSAIAKPPVERRADAFGIQLLAPEEAFVRTWSASARADVGERLRSCMQHFGIGFQAACGHAERLRLLDRSEVPADFPAGSSARWTEAEQQPGERDAEAFASVSVERRGALLTLALRALTARKISRSRALELLELDGDSLDANLERWCRLLSITP
jgi:Zn-dependent peptidase ImmA (M78 family)/transcriptional regulator with XRE-family HTH domain